MLIKQLLILLGQYKWDENISLQYTSAFQTGVYGLWNIYVMGLIFLYAPSHKRWNNSDNNTGKFNYYIYYFASIYLVWEAKTRQNF